MTQPPAAAPPEEVRGDQTREAMLIFRIAGVSLALRVTHVVELCALQEVITLPRLPEHIPGLIKHREEALALLDLGRFLSLERAEEGAREAQREEATLSLERVIVVEAEGMRAGLMCDRASRIIEVEAGALSDAASVRDPLLRRFASAEFETDEGLVICLNIPTLLSEARIR